MSNVLTGGGLIRRFLGSAVSNAAGYAVGGAVLPTLEPLTQDIANEAWQAHQVKPLAASMAAEATLRGFLTQGEGADEASMSGINAQRFATLRDLHGTPPPAGALLELRRRDLISPAELTDGLQQGGIRQQWRALYAQLTEVIPSVTDMVRFAVREVYDPASRSALNLDAEFPGAFAADAENLGLTRERAGQYWAAHWDLPSYEQGVQMLFRGEISAGQFTALLKALDYAPVWRGPLESIARAIPPISDMIRFAVREVYSPAVRGQFGLDDDFPADFVPEAALHGMDDTRARQYWAAHWRMPSAMQGYRMLHRGEINQEQLRLLLRALDYPPFWRSRLEAIAHLVPGRVDLRRFLKAEIIDRDETKAGYQRLGYLPLDAERLTQLAEYEAEQAVEAQPWANRAKGRLYTVAHNEFLDGTLDASEAGSILATLGASGAEANRVLALWQREGEIVVAELTDAQVAKAVKTGKWTAEQGISELVSRGFTPQDAETRLAL